jgi:hypothetical protein
MSFIKKVNSKRKEYQIKDFIEKNKIFGSLE